MEIERCMRDGFSTGGTPGTGLGAVRRLSSVFGVYSQIERGTVVLSRVSRADAGTGQPFAVQFGASASVQGEVECGDTWCIAADEQRMATLVVDGLGMVRWRLSPRRRRPRKSAENPLTVPHRHDAAPASAPQWYARLSRCLCVLDAPTSVWHTRASATSRACWCTISRAGA